MDQWLCGLPLNVTIFYFWSGHTKGFEKQYLQARSYCMGAKETIHRAAFDVLLKHR